MTADPEFPGDSESGMAGLRDAFSLGPPPPPPPDPHARLRAALMTQWEKRVGLRSRRGRRRVNWRVDMRPIVRFVVQHFPNATNAEIARALYDTPDGPNLKLTAGVSTPRTIENWLSGFRRLIG